MDKKLFALIVFAVFLLILLPYAKAGTVGNCTNYANYSMGGRNWTISNATVCQKVNIELNASNITIMSGGSLYLQEVNLILNGSVDAPVIKVMSGGTLKIDNGSKIFSSNGSSLGFSIYYYAGSSGFLNNSSFYNLQNSSGSNGINLAADIEVSNITINNSLGYAMNISAGSPTVKNSTFFDNLGGIHINSASPTLVNITIKLLSDTTTDAGLNLTSVTSGSISNITLINQTYGIVFDNTNLTLNNITIDNSTYGIFAKSSSRSTLVDSFIQNTRVNSGFPLASSVYFNGTSSNSTNITLVGVTYTNYTFDQNTTGKLTVKWFIDVYVRALLNNTLVNGATLYANNSTTMISSTSNSSGTIYRRNLTEHIFYQNSIGWASSESSNASNYTYYNLTIQALKGNSTNTTWTNLTSNKIDGNNITVELNLVTVTVNAQGAGAAATAGGAYTVQNGLVTFTNNTFSFTENTSGSGVAVATLPFGLYTISISQGNYTTNSTLSQGNVINASSTNYTTTVKMFPKINLTGSYGANGFLSATSVAASASYTISGNASYAHNNSASNRTTITISSSPTGISGTNTTGIDGNFTKAMTAPSAAGTYTITLAVNDSYGATESTTTTLTVTASNASDGGTSSSTSGSGGAAGDYGLLISEYDRKISASQGETKETQVVVKNTGVKALEDVGLILSGISSTWYRINITTTGLSTEDLSPGEAVTYKVTFKIPSSATPMTYKGTWRAKDKDSLTLAERTMNLTILQIWTGARVETLNSSIYTLQKELDDLWEDIAKLKAQGINATEAEASFHALNDTLALARNEYDSGDYSSAQTDYDKVNAEISKLKDAVKAIKPTGVVQQLAEALSTPGGIFLFAGVIAAAVIIGFFVWWQFFRVTKMADVKKMPAKFGIQPVRVEGVVKSITETRKGKVFLISDQHGEKLHVRYPYYTTTEIGDLIRVDGIIKTYKNIPYMDATDLQRLSMKPGE